MIFVWVNGRPCVVRRVFWMPATNGPRSKRAAASGGVGRQQFACSRGAASLDLPEVERTQDEACAEVEGGAGVGGRRQTAVRLSLRRVELELAVVESYEERVVVGELVID